MGCCQNNIKGSSLHQQVFCEKIKEAIDSGSLKRMSMILQLLSKKSNNHVVDFIDQDFITNKSYRLNALAYCVYIGSKKMFKYLFEKGASINRMEEILETQNIRAINIMCYKGYLKLLKFYLPIYLRQHDSLAEVEKSFTLDLKDTSISRNNFEIPIHSACRAGMVHIVSYLYNYFKQKQSCPYEFDVKSTNEYLGEDSGLIACSSGNFPLVKLLHENCGIDFKTLNKNKENAIMVCICGNKQTPDFSYLECISYLVEIAKVDVTYMYEEMLFLSDNEEITKYLEFQLEKADIFVKKKDIDKVIVSVQIVHEEKNNSKDPVFTEEIRDFLETNNSVISSISDSRSKRCESESLDWQIS